ncbi:MAG: DoxX family protein [Flavobacteriales bacterium]|nr:DoxX family protein [Flavobacteriales bacterium]MBL6873324.1 DoxX family protein [Flavobacteriales bacterium]
MNLEIQDNVLIITQLLTTIFLAILFIQSGIDKVTDKEGNLSWLSSHFSNSPLKNSVPFLLFTITVLELLAGFGNLIGAFYILFLDNAIVAFFGTLFSSISLIMLFFGQRVAKDYAGAQSLVSYFILTIVTLVLLCW